MALCVDVEKRLGSFHLKVKLRAENETLALLGASGCGKSLTLRCIAGIERPDRGRVELDGRVLFDSERGIDLPPQRRRVGYLFQDYALFPNMTVAGNVACAARPGGPDPGELIRSMGLEGVKDRYPRQLSGGERQRTALARVLANQPEVLLLDEPFSALDSHLRFQLERETRRAIHRFGKTAVLVSHDRDEVFRLSQRVAVMSEGRIEDEGPRGRVFERPRTVNGARLTGCRNLSRAEKAGPGRIRALDWGVELRVEPGTEDMDFVGFRAQDGRLGEGENALLCRVAEVVEDPFSVTVMVRPEAAPEAVPFGISLSKNQWREAEGERVRVSLPLSALLPLKR